MIAAKKKRESRKSVQQSAWMILDGGFATRPCVVVDLSSTGAKITRRRCRYGARQFPAGFLAQHKGQPSVRGDLAAKDAGSGFIR